jgi:tRNA A-37 threonylcarbamoyl transferase component Bud32
MERKSARRPAWWMYVVAASYAVTFGLILYQIVWGPAELRGFAAAFTEGTMMIRSVTAGSPESNGGLRPGDRVVAIDDQPVRAVRDWIAATGNLQVGRPQRWVVARGEDRLSLEIHPVGVSIRSKLAEGYIQYLSLVLTGLAMGLLIAWKRPGDAVGRLGAWFMMTASIAFGFPWGWAVSWRALPDVVQWLLWIPQISRFVLEGTFLSFFLVFPRHLLTRKWLWFVVWAPVLATLPWRIMAFYGVIHPGQVAPFPAWILQAGFARTLVYLVAAIGILAVSYRRLLDLNEKRRVRVLMVGTAASAISATWQVWIDSFLGRAYLQGLGTLLFLTPFHAACPLSLAYAILRHRVLDISVIIRRGLQYALARGAVIGLVPVLGAILIMDLALNSQRPLADILRSRGWFYAAAAGLSLLAYWKRGEWLDAIDRRFFRERYNAQQVLREVLGEIQTARNFERVAPRVVERIETAFHPEFVSVMVRAPGEPAYRSLASVPTGQAPPSLAADSKLVGLLRVLGKPLEVPHADSNWLDGRLPHEETDLIRRARIDLLVPIATTPGQAEALLVLGIKRSEEPYTPEDQEFLEAIGASLALLVEPPAPVAERVSGTFQECPECGVCYEPASAVCSGDGATLVRTGVPRTLAGRYRLDRRRGHGGMGTVYEATDSALDRHVAVKLIRDDWVDSVEAVQRFRREARAAAGFAHPNVVTVHDYGVEAETRAFLVMELLQGVTLRDELNRRKRLAPSRVTEIMRGVCAAVEAAHQRQLIHRDLKPENIFLSRSTEAIGEVVKVLDFGVAKFLPANDDSTPTRTRAETRTGVLVGTPAYMSPEQLLGEKLDTQWDLWALAVVAYEALTGALPFATAGTDWRRAVMAGNFTLLSEHFAEPPPIWQSFFGHCFSTDRGQRPTSGADFFRQIEQALGKGTPPLGIPEDDEQKEGERC